MENRVSDPWSDVAGALLGGCQQRPRIMPTPPLLRHCGVNYSLAFVERLGSCRPTLRVSCQGSGIIRVISEHSPSGPGRAVRLCRAPRSCSRGLVCSCASSDTLRRRGEFDERPPSRTLVVLEAYMGRKTRSGFIHDIIEFLVFIHYTSC